MTKFLLIGPSGIGKSTVLKILSANENFETYDLDQILDEQSGSNLTDYAAQLGWKGFFGKSVEIIESLESKKIIVVAVGAQSIEHIAGHKWYLEQETISLTGDPNEIYPRSNREIYHPTFESYDLTEFSAWRLKLYNSTKYKIDVTKLTENEVAEEITKIISSKR